MSQSISQRAVSQVHDRRRGAAEILRGLCTHLIDHGRIELGTEQSRDLIAAATVLGAWHPSRDGTRGIDRE